MKRVLAVVIAAFFALPANADQAPAQGLDAVAPEAGATDLSKFLWKKRLLIVFADSAGDPRFTEQVAMIEARVEDLVARDVVVLIDTDPAAESDLRDKFHPRGFMLVLMGKDGNVYLRKPRPWDVREISRSIDKMPIRREELRNN